MVEDAVDDARGAPVVLFVDDEAFLLRAIARMLNGKPFAVLTATTMEEVEALLSSAAVVDCVVSDYRMPDVTGLDVLRAVQRLRPTCARLIMTGQAEPGALLAALNGGLVQRVVEKPFTRESMQVAIADCIAEARQRAD